MKHPFKIGDIIVPKKDLISEDGQRLFIKGELYEVERSIATDKELIYGVGAKKTKNGKIIIDRAISFGGADSWGHHFRLATREEYLLYKLGE